VGIGDVNLGQAMTHGPRVTYGLPPMHHYDKGAFTANEIDEELKKGVYSKCLGKKSIECFSEAWNPECGETCLIYIS